MKRILFAFYPLFVDFNHGISLLSALCKQQSIDTDLVLLSKMEDFREKISQGRYDYIGFSCVTRQDFGYCLPFIKIAKKAGCNIMLGGVFPSRVNLEYNVTVCRGEAEMLPLWINSGMPPMNNCVCKDLDSLPVPDYELFSEYPYNRELPWFPDAKYLFYTSSRGCPYNCSFCAIKFQPPGQRIRYKVEEDLIPLIGKYNPDIIAFGDSLPPYYNERWRDSWGNLHHKFVCYIRADIKPEHLTWLHDRGMVACFFGVESGNEVYRNKIFGKNLLDKDIMRTVDTLKGMNIPFVASYIKNGPEETWEIKGQTAKMAKVIGGHPVFYNYEERSLI